MTSPGGGSLVGRYPALSADGRIVAFQSDASNLVANDTNGAMDVFVHDRQSGTTERVSVNSSGAEKSGASDFPALSSDGRLVVFESTATNLVAGDTNGFRVTFFPLSFFISDNMVLIPFSVALDLETIFLCSIR